MTATARALATRVLVVNRHLQAVHITNARRAFILLWTDLARALDETWVAHDFAAWESVPPSDGDLAVGTSRGPIRVPRVVQLVTFDRLPRAVVRLTRRNILLRDGHTCQYCGRVAHPRELNLDHVVPRSRGGPLSWENLVCSCRACNHRKGSRTPAEAGMRLLRKPLRPRWSPILTAALSADRPPAWEPFLASLPGARELTALTARAGDVAHDDALAESA